MCFIHLLPRSCACDLINLDDYVCEHCEENSKNFDENVRPRRRYYFYMAFPRRDLLKYFDCPVFVRIYMYGLLLLVFLMSIVE